MDINTRRPTRPGLVSVSPQNFVDFGRRNRVVVARSYPQIKCAYLRFHVGALAKGYLWRPLAQLRAVSTAHLVIGGRIIETVTSEQLQTKFLHQGFRYHPDNAFRQMTNDAQTFIAPVSDITVHLNMLDFHEVRYEFTVAEFESLIIRDPAAEEPDQSLPPSPPQPSLSVELVCACDSTAEIEYVHPIVVHHTETHRCYTNDGEHTFDLSGSADGAVTAVYVLVQNIDGSEIPFEAVDVIRCVKNMSNPDSEYMTGNESRHIQPTLLPPEARPSTYRIVPSENLYCIATSSSDESGINIQRRDGRARLQIRFKLNAPEQVKVSVTVRQTQLALRYQSGICMFVSQLPPVPLPTLSLALAQIDPWVSVDSVPIDPDATCLITLIELSVGQSVAQCTECHKTFSKAVLEQWLARASASSCPHCRSCRRFTHGPARAAT